MPHSLNHLEQPNSNHNKHRRHMLGRLTPISMCMCLSSGIGPPQKGGVHLGFTLRSSEWVPSLKKREASQSRPTNSKSHISVESPLTNVRTTLFVSCLTGSHLIDSIRFQTQTQKKSASSRKEMLDVCSVEVALSLTRKMVGVFPNKHSGWFLLVKDTKGICHRLMIKSLLKSWMLLELWVQ